MAKIQNNTKEVTLENITNEDILAMAQYIQQLEQLSKDQRGYILQLQQQLMNLGKRIKEAQSSNLQTVIVETATLDLEE